MKDPTRKLKTAVIRLTFILILGVVLPLYALKVSQKQDYTDFDVYYRAAVRASHLQWTEVYTLKDGASPFRYLPLLIPIFQPFSALGLPQAKLVWFFLQFLWFGLGFYYIYRSLRVIQRTEPRSESLWISCLSALFILRFCLDTFTIGQVSSLMFFGLSLGFYFWIIRKPTWASIGLLIPTVLKIGPGFLYGIFLSSPWKDRARAVRGILLCGSLGLSLSFLNLKSFATFTQLWGSWAMIVAKDSTYYDASHYGSQSLKSFLLREVNSTHLNLHLASQIYLISAVLICSVIALFWLLRRPRSFHGRGLFYSLGIFPYIWLMPETFKYSLTPLALPVALLFASQKKPPLTRFALTVGIFTLSLPGKDIVGDSIFFGLQNSSCPLFATIFLGSAVIQLAWANSAASPFLKLLKKGLLSRTRSLWTMRSLGPWKSLPSAERKLKISWIIPLPQGPLTDGIRNYLLQADALCQKQVGSSYEILLVLNQPSSIPFELPPSLKILNNSELDGRGAALRTGFLASQGETLLLTHLDQACDLAFYQKALPFLDQGYDLIRANRRLAESYFRIPVRILPLVYGRHRLGLLLNRSFRRVFPLHTTDTLSGNVAISSRLATHTFAVQKSPDFLFDLELSLTSISHGYREKDLPVTVILNEEKSFQQILVETLHLLRGLPGLIRRYRRGCYQPLPHFSGITADDWGISPGVNQGILKLAQMGVVKRVSILANSRYLKEGLTELRSIPNIELGLHFNLTYGNPCQKHPDLTSPLLEQTGRRKGTLISSPGRFLFQWLNPLGNSTQRTQHVREELKSQLEHLKKMKLNIQYLDGHHHIHLVPGLIACLADLIQGAGIKRVRLPNDPSLRYSSKVSLVLLSGLAHSKFKKYGFESLPCLYPPSGRFKDQGMLRATLAQCPEAEIIVHPAETDDLGTLEFPDSYTSERVMEFRALQMIGNQFLKPKKPPRPETQADQS